MSDTAGGSVESVLRTVPNASTSERSSVPSEGRQNPQPVSNDNTIFVVKNNKITGYLGIFTPKNCEFCGRRITNHDRIEAPYADGRYLCTWCRGEYMDLHHADPFRVINPKEEGTS